MVNHLVFRWQKTCIFHGFGGSWLTYSHQKQDLKQGAFVLPRFSLHMKSLFLGYGKGVTLKSRLEVAFLDSPSLYDIFIEL